MCSAEEDYFSPIPGDPMNVYGTVGIEPQVLSFSGTSLVTIYGQFLGHAVQQNGCVNIHALSLSLSSSPMCGVVSFLVWCGVCVRVWCVIPLVLFLCPLTVLGPCSLWQTGSLKKGCPRCNVATIHPPFFLSILCSVKAVNAGVACVSQSSGGVVVTLQPSTAEQIVLQVEPVWSGKYQLCICLEDPTTFEAVNNGVFSVEGEALLSSTS